ncbi:MAG: peptidoglycan bridge formation glycyltransferase FemA/FemB family protein [Candidatus Parcubacteria bacterium]|nr:peptidoglycan bridge formation glycyltransferase FemA/FemB family protein [Candidatus Parcubacteria bacterium]
MKNYFINHPLQSNEWGEFRKKTGIKVIRINGMQMTIHSIPHTPWNIGYIPKGPSPTKVDIDELKKIGREEKCIFIQLEPNILEIENSKLEIENLGFKSAAHPLFTKHTFVLDLTKNEEELLKGMHPKTRYNIKVALKHDVKIAEDDSDKAFEEYLKLTRETTSRQGFFAHTEKYHRLMWAALKNKIAHLFLAKYNDQTLAAWILFVYGDTLYYPYGASSSLHRETMASNLMMWEAIKFGKKLGLKKFDMWGSLGFDPDKNDPWYGFHKFKEGYGPKLIESAGSFDLVINPFLYNAYVVMDKLRWIILRLKK